MEGTKRSPQHLEQKTSHRIAMRVHTGYALTGLVSPYSIPFVDSTFPASRSSSVVAWSSALASPLKMASMM